jgi:FAD/FMN-containing dehydrogenase
MPWLYLNYALPWQKVYESFGDANHQKMKDVKKRYDPNNVFGRLWPGGFKL